MSPAKVARSDLALSSETIGPLEVSDCGVATAKRAAIKDDGGCEENRPMLGHDAVDEQCRVAQHCIIKGLGAVWVTTARMEMGEGESHGSNRQDIRGIGAGRIHITRSRHPGRRLSLTKHSHSSPQQPTRSFSRSIRYIGLTLFGGSLYYEMNVASLKTVPLTSTVSPLGLVNDNVAGFKY